jgi:hypothetical protein
MTLGNTRRVFSVQNSYGGGEINEPIRVVGGKDIDETTDYENELIHWPKVKDIIKHMSQTIIKKTYLI